MGIEYWTDARVERLKVMHEAGASASIIAADLGGISRNAAIGKIHRLGLPTRGNNGNYKGNGRSAGAPKTIVTFRPKPRATPIVVPASIIIPRNLSILDLMPNDCRYPYTDGDGLLHTFCGHPKFPGSSYCPGHFTEVRRKDDRKREGQPTKMPTNMAGNVFSRSVLA